MPDDYLDQLRPEDRAKKYDFGNLDPIRPQTIIATAGGEIRGFATTAPAQDSNLSGYGELCALYVDPDHWGRGIGVALVSAARARLFDLGYRNAILWVLLGNVPRSAFIAGISGPQTEDGEWKNGGALRYTMCAIGVTLKHRKRILNVGEPLSYPRQGLPVTLTHPSDGHAERNACITSTRAAGAAGSTDAITATAISTNTETIAGNAPAS